MASYIKKHWSKGAKIAGAVFFALLMFVNVKLTTNPNTRGDLDLFGLKLSLFTPSTYACGNGTCCHQNGAACVIGNIILTNYYYGGPAGPCP